MGIELKRPYWQERAQELFLVEHEKPSDFYAKYPGAVDVYSELSNRLNKDQPEAAYHKMYEAFMADVRENSHNMLDFLIRMYTEGNENDDNC